MMAETIPIAGTMITVNIRKNTTTSGNAITSTNEGGTCPRQQEVVADDQGESCRILPYL